MWKLLHKLFGWDYVYVENSATGKIVRVKMAPNGLMVFQPYSFQVIVIPEPLPITGEWFGGWRVVPLTGLVTQMGD